MTPLIFPTLLGCWLGHSFCQCVLILCRARDATILGQSDSQCMLSGQHHSGQDQCSASPVGQYISRVADGTLMETLCLVIIWFSLALWSVSTLMAYELFILHSCKWLIIWGYCVVLNGNRWLKAAYLNISKTTFAETTVKSRPVGFQCIGSSEPGPRSYLKPYNT